MKASIPVNFDRKVRALFGLGLSAELVMPVELHVAVLITKPHLLSTTREVELHFSKHLVGAVGIGQDFDTNFRRDGKAESAAVGCVACARNPHDIRNLGAVRSLDGALHDDFSILQKLLEQCAYFRLKSSVPGICGTHDDLVKAVGFNFVRQVAQVAIRTNVSPGNHGDNHIPLQFFSNHGFRP